MAFAGVSGAGKSTISSLILDKKLKAARFLKKQAEESTQQDIQSYITIAIILYLIHPDFLH